ncbi:MAG TPA: DUF6457 domain-containing protein [Solirubrobacterales bacterium]|nr:DUF6457 domain-containing protein [Solirubrobacterales bacterium]
MTSREWVERFAAEAGVEAPSESEFEEVLRLAAEAAHSSERQAAPIATWLAGKTGRPISELADLAERLESS